MKAGHLGALGAGLYVEVEQERAIGRAGMPGRQFEATRWLDFGIRPINAQFRLLMASWMMLR